MKRLKTLKATKKDLQELQAYVYLVENYRTDTLEKRIIKTYAFTNSIPKVLAEINAHLETNDLAIFSQSFLRSHAIVLPSDKNLQFLL